MNIKICGLTRAADATLAHQSGAWALGFIFYPKSKRFITPAAAAALIPQDAKAIGVFVNQMAEIADALAAAPLWAVQLHGDETPEAGTALKQEQDIRIIKAFRLQQSSDIATLRAWEGIADYMLIDAAVPGEWGGTGTVADWDLARQARDVTNTPLILSGGITAENICAAQDSVAPFAFDLASGVESAPGVKASDKINLLFQTAGGHHHATQTS